MGIYVIYVVARYFKRKFEYLAYAGELDGKEISYILTDFRRIKYMVFDIEDYKAICMDGV